jgi:septum formation protein
VEPRPGRRGDLSCTLVSRLVDELPLVLASGSPRRARILAGLELDFVVDRSGVCEDSLEGESPEEHVERLSRSKSLEVVGRHPLGTVLGADTTVLLDGKLLGKPRDADDAVKMLRTIRGRWHEVLTGVTAARCSDRAVASGYERTRVLVRALSDSDIDEYVAGGEPLDKAGSYGIQDCGAAVVERVEGCFYNVVGLPIARLCSVLEELRSVREKP